jgi:hypothetical protein
VSRLALAFRPPSFRKPLPVMTVALPLPQALLLSVSRFPPGPARWRRRGTSLIHAAQCVESVQGRGVAVVCVRFFGAHGATGTGSQPVRGSVLGKATTRKQGQGNGCVAQHASFICPSVHLHRLPANERWPRRFQQAPCRPADCLQIPAVRRTSWAAELERGQRSERQTQARGGSGCEHMWPSRVSHSSARLCLSSHPVVRFCSRPDFNKPNMSSVRPQDTPAAGSASASAAAAAAGAPAASSSAGGAVPSPQPASFDASAFVHAVQQQLHEDVGQ